MGSAGLSRAEVKRLNEIFVDQVRGRVRVIGGIIPDNNDAIEPVSRQKRGVPRRCK